MCFVPLSTCLELILLICFVQHNIGPVKQIFWRKIAIIHLSISLIMCFGCSKEPSHWDSSFEYPQPMFWLRNKKIIFRYALLSGAWHSLCLFYRLEGPHPGQGLMTEGYTRNADSPISEDPDYAEESENGGETEHNNERGKVPISIGLDKQTFWAQKCKYFNSH